MPILSIDGEVFAARRGGAVFTARGDVYGEIHTVQTLTDDYVSKTVVGSVELTVWGDYAQGDMLDRSARVTITHYFAQSATYSYTKATAWNGRKWADFADGGRAQIADLVMARIIDDVQSTYNGWFLVTVKAHDEDVERRARNKTEEAARCQAEAKRILAEPMPPIHWPATA